MSLVDRVRERLVISGAPAHPAQLAAALRAEGLVLGDEALGALVEDMHREISGAGPLQVLIDDPRTTDVVVNGPNSVFIDRGEGLQPADVNLGTEARVRALAQRLAAAAGRRLDDACPYLDARLPSGARLHCLLPPIATDGTCISIRVPRAKAFTLAELEARGTVDSAAAEILRTLIRTRAAIVITGGTGTGKTTILATLIGEVDPAERIVIAEDSAELQPIHPHLVRIQARVPHVEGNGAITLRDLVRQTLRMRPDRIILGEVRGAEIIDLLTAMNTGHEGGMVTVHANAPEDLPRRIEALGLLAGVPREAMHALLLAAIDVVIHMERAESGQRRLAAIHVLQDRDGWAEAVPAYHVNSGERGPAWNVIEERGCFFSHQ